jgi:hypothetical protein
VLGQGGHMVYSANQKTETCTVCGAKANILRREFGVGTIVDCDRCGDFHLNHVTADQLGLPFREEKRQALASYSIRKLQGTGRAKLDLQFFHQLDTHSLPSPSEASDNLLLSFAEQADGRPGAHVQYWRFELRVLSQVGVVNDSDLDWLCETLASAALINILSKGAERYICQITARGWQRVEELKRAHISSRYAFFARRFDNPRLDIVFEKCLVPSVRATEFELRTVTQKGGLIDAIMEDEIRRCRFLIADLSDKNAGAYWEAGFAEGLGKPVIYICEATDGDGNPRETHFDTSHRHTVKWDVTQMEKTARELKAVIRNTLLGDAKQED